MGDWFKTQSVCKQTVYLWGVLDKKKKQLYNLTMETTFPSTRRKKTKEEKKLSYPKIQATYWQNGKKYVIRTTYKTKRLYAVIRAGKFTRIYFKVLYGMRKTSQDKMEMFYNDCEANNQEDALLALKAFLE